jgi:hypothetical protein
VDKVFKDTPVEGSLPSCCNGEYNEWPTRAFHFCLQESYVFYWASVFHCAYIHVTALILCWSFQSFLLLFFQKSFSL